MNQSFDSQSLQKQVEEMQLTLGRVMTQIARISDGHTSHVIRDLTQLSLSLTSMKNSFSSHMQTHQRQIGALVGVGSVINSSLGLKRVLAEVMDRLIALMN